MLAKHQSDNLKNCFTRLWLCSDPLIRNAEPLLYCRSCNLKGHKTITCSNNKEKYNDPKNLEEFYLSILLDTDLMSDDENI